MKKRTMAIVLVLLVVSVIYAVGLYYAIQLHNTWMKAELEKIPPDLRPYSDLPWFSNTSTGLWYIFCGSGLAWSWALLFSVKLYQRGRANEKSHKDYSFFNG
jgi:hypothetical protein